MQFELIKQDSNVRLGELSIANLPNLPTPLLMPAQLFVAEQHVLNADEWLNGEPGLVALDVAGLFSSSSTPETAIASVWRQLPEHVAIFADHYLLEENQETLSPDYYMQFIKQANVSAAVLLTDAACHYCPVSRKLAERRRNNLQQCIELSQQQAIPLLIPLNLTEEPVIEQSGDAYALDIGHCCEQHQLVWPQIRDLLTRLPADKPRYLKCANTLADLVQAVWAGADIISTSLHTQSALAGSLLTQHGVIQIANEAYQALGQAVDEACCCYTCREFTQAYLHYLWRANPLLAKRLIAIHNAHYCQCLMVNLRKSIEFDSCRVRTAHLTKFSLRYLNQFVTL